MRKHPREKRETVKRIVAQLDQEPIGSLVYVFLYLNQAFLYLLTKT